MKLNDQSKNSRMSENDPIQAITGAAGKPISLPSGRIGEPIAPSSGRGGEPIPPPSSEPGEPLVLIAGIRRPADLERIRSADEMGAITVHYGCDQNWYQDPFQQKAGCGPCAAANLIDYTGRPLQIVPSAASTPPEQAVISTPQKQAAASTLPSDFVQLMHEVWHFVTPGLMGVHRTRHLAGGLDRYAREHNLQIRSVRLEIPVRRKRRPQDADAIMFIRKGLESDSPVAFLNRSNGVLTEPESWHWVTITALYRLPDETCLAEIANYGIRSLIDLSTWLRTTRLGGGFVYCQALGSPAE